MLVIQYAYRYLERAIIRGMRTCKKNGTFFMSLAAEEKLIRLFDCHFQGNDVHTHQHQTIANFSFESA